MSLKERTINVDIMTKEYTKLKYKQGDSNQTLKFKFYKNGSELDLTGYVAGIFYEKPNKEVLEKTGTISENTVTTIITSGVLNAVGVVKTEIFLTKDDEVSISFTILIEVEASIDKNAAVQEKEEWDIIKDLLINGNNISLIDDSSTTTNKTWSSSKIDSQIKEIGNYSLVKHTDGLLYIKKQDGTLIGTGVEVGSGDVDLSTLSMTISGQDLKLLDGTSELAKVTIPTAVVTDEQLTAIIDAKIADGTLSSLLLGDDSVDTNNIKNNAITPEKTNFINKQSEKIYINVYDTSTLTIGKLNNNGTIDTSVTHFKVTDFIEVKNGTEITTAYVNIYTFTPILVIYDKDKNVLGTKKVSSLDELTKNVEYTCVIDYEDACYVRINLSTSSSLTWDDLYIYISSANISYKLIGESEIIKEEKGQLYKSVYNESETEIGTLNTSTGKLQTGAGYTGYKATPYIRYNGEKIKVKLTNSTLVYYYSYTKLFLGTQEVSDSAFLIDNADAYYIRVSTAVSLEQDVWLEKSSYAYIKDDCVIGTINDENETDYTTYSSKYINNTIDNLDFNRAKWKNKKIIVDGDSITATGTWHSWLKSWFNLSTVENHARSGENLTSNSNPVWSERVNAYSSDADAILIMGDGNDYGTVGVYSDTDDTTWCGRMNQYLDAIITKFPTTPVVLISNPPRADTSDIKRNGLGGLYDEQAKAMKDLANNRNLYYIDCYHTNMFRPWVSDNVSVFGKNGVDTVHLNELGDKMMAQQIYEEMKKIGIDF